MKKTITLFMLLAMATVCVNAAIVRGSITTKTVYGESRLSLDFNGDGVEDFQLMPGYDDNGNDAPDCYVVYDNQWSNGHNIWANGTENDGWDNPKNLALNTSIGANGNWIGQGDASLLSWVAGAYLPYNTDLYFGFRINNTNYGWARVTMSNAGGITAATWHEIYYETSANTPILAGAKGSQTGVETATADIVLYPNPTADMANVTGLNGNEEIMVCDMNGRMIETIRPQGVSTVSVNLSTLAAGYYVISVKEAGKNVVTMLVNKK